ncbi:AAA ATPase-like domain-containing protein, LysM domain-containing [Desulfonema limicola]|uniref:AAA ATPase-like domain-containing protein, LysM domain-containing n=1 Tax=Desulfonema limicola TaxID=45656 RepID=A0A975B5T7_9BACT|nr:AAA family ATPase [Desulfonema limicola]QTA79324.1 AAA ATPase-like domain-containing protein, LysM domain-containing [Desulfonema limicola]
MEYFKILNLDKEPFSNSPDPDLFFQSCQHLTCLQRLEIAIRLKRGLNIVIGDVGTGKTTLCRQLIRKFTSDKDIETFLILDPFFDSLSEALAAIAAMFKINTDNDSKRQIKEKIKNFLFLNCVDKKKTIILIIDEGQKLNDFFIEILREFLNYETNEYKLLQIVIFAQKEFEKTLRHYKNFSDRINLFFYLQPLNFFDMKKMVWFRLQKSGYAVNNAQSLFTYPGLWKIYRQTRGYPRKIMNLCHQCILMAVIQNQNRIGWYIVRACAKREILNSGNNRYSLPCFIIFFILLSVLTGIVFSNQSFLELVKSKFIIQGNGKTINLHDKNNFNTNISGIKEFIHGKEIQEQSRISDILGQIEVKQGETLGKLVKQIYGTVNPGIIQKILEINPHIKSPNRISIGQKLSFPCIPVKINYSPDQSFLIEIANENSLESAFETLRLHTEKDDHLPIKLIPYQTDKSKRQFVLIYDQCFLEKESMQKKIDELRTRLNLQLKRLRLWDQDTIFFSVPCRK